MDFNVPHYNTLKPIKKELTFTLANTLFGFAYTLFGFAYTLFGFAYTLFGFAYTPNSWQPAF